jgi:hypothetical protein
MDIGEYFNQTKYEDIINVLLKKCSIERRRAIMQLIKNAFIEGANAAEKQLIKIKKEFEK